MIIINNEKDLYEAGELFRMIFEKFSQLESKRNLYKNITDLTLIEINTILVIGCGEMKSMSSIATSLGVSFGTPTVTIDRLIEKGYVKRIRDLEDRRQVFVELSDVGINAYNSLCELKNKVTEKVFGILTQEERESLIGILFKMDAELDNIRMSLSSL